LVASRSTYKTLYSAEYRIIWCPKYPPRVPGGLVEAPLKQIIAGVVAGGVVIEVEGMPDHVQLLVEVRPAVALSKLKGVSSRALRAEAPALRRGGAVSSPSWFVSTVGGAPLEVVRRYVENHKAAA
jgi:putative transposase